MRFRRSLLSLFAAVVAVSGLSLAPSARAREEAPPRPERGRHDGEHVLVGFRPGTPGAERAVVHAAQGAAVRNRFDHIDVDVVRVPEGQDPVTVSARYERNPNVEFAHPNWQVTALSTPDDTLFGDQWGLHNTAQAVTLSTGSLYFDPVADADVDAPEGWDTAFGAGNFVNSGGARVAIIDTGIDRAHLDLTGKTAACASALTAIGVVTEGVCDDDNLHGTHVAGTVAANTGNGLGVAGVAPSAELAVFKALNGAGLGFTADIVAGIHWAYTTGGARIISMSLGSYESDGTEHRAVKDATAAGALVIAAAGNDGDGTVNYPAGYPEVVSVASISQDGNRSWFSNCNSDVEIAAPGEDIWSTFPGNSYGLISGTSMSTPHVSGVAAMVLAQQPSLTVSELRRQLTSTAQGSGGCNGVGVVNLAAALGSAAPAPEPTPTEPGGIAGAVRDQKSKTGIAGASVDCVAGGAATTGTDGRYAITGVAPGSYSCTASAAGYRSKTQSVTVTSGLTSTLDFGLQKTR